MDLLKCERRASSLTPTPVAASGPNASNSAIALSTDALSSKEVAATAALIPFISPVIGPIFAYAVLARSARQDTDVRSDSEPPMIAP